MKNARKIIFIVLALLPCLALICYVVGNIGNVEGVPYTPMGSVNIEDMGADGVKIVAEAETLADRILTPLLGQDPLTGVFEAVGRLFLFLQDNIGLTISLPVVLSMFYLLYYAFLQLCDTLVSLITFVPRKCAELFN